jgi:hypothetical protein
MSKKVGKLKLNDSFKKKLESSIGMKINSSNSSSIPNKPKKKFTINNDPTPFIPPLPPILKQLSPITMPEIYNNEEQNIVKKEYIPSNDKGIVINNNITYPLPIINNNEIPVSNNLIAIAKLFFENNKNNKGNKYKGEKINKKNNDNFFSKKISIRDLICFILTFTTGYWFGRLSK